MTSLGSFDSSSTSQTRKRSRLSLAFSVIVLMACSTPHQQAQVSRQDLRATEGCSTFGALACATVARLSTNTTSTCSVSIGSGGRRMEICGAVPERARRADDQRAQQHKATSAGAPIPAPIDPTTYPVQISWADNSDNEDHFVIERCDGTTAASPQENTDICTGRWDQIAIVGANTTSYTDNNAQVNRTYIYRIKAVNSAGSSTYTQEALIRTPSAKSGN